MTDEHAETTREQRIAAAEAEQERRHSEGGTVEERIARLRELSAEITGTPAAGPDQ
jgi:hypothetical protein